MKTYEWCMYNSFGEIQAKNIKDATVKVVKHMLNSGYESDTIIRFEIKVKLKK